MQLSQVIVQKNLSALAGSGSDGDVTLTGNVTLTRDMFYENLNVSPYTLFARNYRIFVRNTLTIGAGGRVQARGGDGILITGGAAVPLGTFLASGAGAAQSANGESVLNSFGGAAGNGGDAGGNGGSATRPSANYGGLEHVTSAVLGHLMHPVSGEQAIRAGAGGGGGDGGGAKDGGGGGGGGGYLVLFATRIVNNGSINADGGNGGPAANLGGGGGGGGGGVCIVGYRILEGSGTITANGGTGGPGDGTGSPGQNGQPGTLARFEC